VRGEELDKSNILVDFKVLKGALNKILDYLDHKDINELPEFKGVSPSSEILCKFIYTQLKKEIPNLHKVSVYETETSRASYWE